MTHSVAMYSVNMSIDANVLLSVNGCSALC